MDAASARGPIAGFRAAGTGNFRPVRFTIADLALLDLGRTVEQTLPMVPATVAHGSSIDPTLVVDEQFSRWGTAAPPLPAAIPQVLDCIDLSAVAEQALESVTGADGLDALLGCDRLYL